MAVGDGSLQGAIAFLGSFLYGNVDIEKYDYYESDWIKSMFLPHHKHEPHYLPTKPPEAIDWARDVHVRRWLTVKFGYDPAHIMSRLWPRFNTIMMPILSAPSFAQDLAYASVRAADETQLFGMLADKQEERLMEMLDVLGSFYGLLAPEPLGGVVPSTERWARPIVQLACRSSVDGLIRFIIGFAYDGWDGDDILVDDPDAKPAGKNEEEVQGEEEQELVEEEKSATAAAVGGKKRKRGKDDDDDGEAEKEESGKEEAVIGGCVTTGKRRQLSGPP